jgi:hypothetical protein
MDKRALLNLSLLLVVGALGALIWHERSAPPAEDADQPLLFPTVAEATRLAVVERDQPRWTLEKVGGAWRLTAPFAAAADPIVVAELIGSLAATRSRAHYPASVLDPKATGLDAPHAIFEVTVAGAVTRFDLGGTEPINYRRYVRSGDAVHLVDDLISYRLLQDGAQLASKRLLPDGAKLVRLELPGRTLARGADGRWTLAPDDAQVSADALTALVANWERAAASAVRARQDGVVQAMVRITVEGVAAPIELAVLTAVDGLRFERQDLGLEYELPAAARAELLELPRGSASPPAATTTAPPGK